MERDFILGEITNAVNLTENGFIDVEGCDLWFNNSNNCEGEDLEVWGIGVNKFGVYGVCVGDNDFFAFDELTDDELEDIYEIIKE